MESANELKISWNTGSSSKKKVKIKSILFNIMFFKCVVAIGG